MGAGSFPILSVDDLRAASAFYRDLGFTQTFRFPDDGDPVFITMSRGDSSLGLAVGPDGDDRVGYWVYVDDVDVAFERLVARGAEVVAPVRTEPWGERVARIRDPAGTLVYLGSSIED